MTQQVFDEGSRARWNPSLGWDLAEATETQGFKESGLGKEQMVGVLGGCCEYFKQLNGYHNIAHHKTAQDI